MLRELLRSTLYSSSRPFSRSATRRSSFSTLIISLLPVLGEPRPKIRFTFSIISGESGCDHEPDRFLARVRFDQSFHLRVGRRTGVGAGGCVAFGRMPKSLSKKLGDRKSVV